MTTSHQEIIQRFRAHLAIENKLPATVESYGRDAEAFLRFIKSHDLDMELATPEWLIWFKEYLFHETGGAENSVRRAIIGTRQFYRFLVTEKVVPDSPFDGVPIPERDESLDKTMTEADYSKVQAAVAGNSLKQSRDKAILALIGWDGLKANEIINLKWSQYISSRNDSGLMQIPGERSRTVKLSPASVVGINNYQKHFNAWLESYDKIEIRRFEWLFVSFKGKDTIQVVPKLTRHGLKFMLGELGAKTGILHLHSEGLRHLAMERMIREGMSPDEIKAHLGLRQIGNIGKHLAKYRVSNVD